MRQNIQPPVYFCCTDGLDFLSTKKKMFPCLVTKTTFCGILNLSSV
uniref:Uncharacterized protein n=1 Tax=Anguilla anguilla TaxID=7936 RepID=A0A0E9UY15_ANGAN